MKYRLQKRRPDVTDERLSEVQAAFDALPEEALYGDIANESIACAMRVDAWNDFWYDADDDCIIGERVGANDSEISNSSWQDAEADQHRRDRPSPL